MKVLGLRTLNVAKFIYKGFETKDVQYRTKREMMLGNGYAHQGFKFTVINRLGESHSLICLLNGARRVYMEII